MKKGQIASAAVNAVYTEPGIVDYSNSFSKSQFYFMHASINIPHRTKVDKGGEDAWIATPDLLVVADGVGGWANKGVDPGLFSK